MKITDITVNGLFGIFDHHIPLNTVERITILFGPNGFGKTFVLRLVNAFLTADYRELHTIPFGILVLGFDDGGVCRLIKKPDAVGERLSVEYERSGGTTESYTPPDHEPAWLSDIRRDNHVRFINTERLMEYGGREGDNRPVIVKYATELRELIEEKLAAYATLSQSLDRTFPARLIRGKAGRSLTLEGLKKRLRSLERIRERLAGAGLLDREPVEDNVLDSLTESSLNVLSVYAGDAAKKLGVFDDVIDRIELFIRLVNRKFLHKRMDISRDSGFVFTASDGKVLDPDNLSSGEQHAVVLYYLLLFSVEPGSFILIDEPELSLHIIWQQQFIRDIIDIVSLDGFEVLIATHSPQIIHDRWDLAVELRDPRS